jgi:hypothetical protein
LLALLKTLLGESAGGYYGSLEYAKHFIGTGASRMSANSPDIAALVGKRLVAVNETPTESGGPGGVFNTTLAKSLASGDEPLSATAKYKDPMSFRPQCRLIFCTNSNPEFPANDGGFKSRVSYVNMPFEWVAAPTEPGQRQIDPQVKENLVKTLHGEFWFWACQLSPGLLKPKGRLITPQPEKVLADKSVQFAAGLAASAGATASPREIGEQYVKARLFPWSRSWGSLISSRDEINRDFMTWCQENGYRARPHEAFRGVLEGPVQKTRVTVNGSKIHVYWRPVQQAMQAPGVMTEERLTLMSSVPREWLPQ